MTQHSISPVAWVNGLWRNRDLVRRLVAREFTAKYRGSVLGVVWAIITPLLLALIFVFLFGIVFQARWGTEEMPPASFTVTFLVGMLIHSILAEGLARAPALILGNAAYVKRVVFPLEILPVTIVANAVMTAGIGLVIVLVIHLFTSGVVHPTAALLPVVVMPFAIAVLGIVYFLAALSVYLRDLMQVTGLVTTATLFLAPIFYPITAVPEPFRQALYLNPLTFAVEQARAVGLYGQLPDWWGLAIYYVAATFVCWLGYAWFQKTRKGFADVV